MATATTHPTMAEVSVRFAEKHSDSFRYCQNHKCWSVRTGDDWKLDARKLVEHTARVFIRELRLGASWGTWAKTANLVQRAAKEPPFARCEGCCDYAAGGGA